MRAYNAVAALLPLLPAAAAAGAAGGGPKAGVGAGPAADAPLEQLPALLALEFLLTQPSVHDVPFTEDGAALGCPSPSSQSHPYCPPPSPPARALARTNAERR